MIIKPRGSLQPVNANKPMSLRCPVCRQTGTFNTVIQQDLSVQVLIQDQPSPRIESCLLGLRVCPNRNCRACVFIVAKNDEVLASYPPERIDFDASKIPNSVVGALEEAITCHANQCYIAAAIMVRKALEELCREREAKGKNLNERLKALGSKVVLPTELLEGLDDLRLLGNDAAHIESEVFASIGQTEVEVGIDFAKEVLKAVYQYGVLLERLRSLRKEENQEGNK